MAITRHFLSISAVNFDFLATKAKSWTPSVHRRWDHNFCRIANDKSNTFYSDFCGIRHFLLKMNWNKIFVESSRHPLCQGRWVLTVLHLQELIKNTEREQLRTISTYYFGGQGKALRPMIAILMARAINYHKERK